MREVALRATLLLAVVACAGADPGTPQVRNAASVELTISSDAPMASLGETRTLTAVVRDSSNEIISNAPVSWSSNAAGVVALVAPTGLTSTAKAIGNGEATITATSGSASATIATAVAQQVTGVLVWPNPAEVVMTATDSSKQLEAIAHDAHGNAVPGPWSFTWVSSNPETATVDQAGLVHGYAQGIAGITASLSMGTTTLTSKANGLVFPQSNPPAIVSNESSTGLPSTVTISAGSMVVWQFTGGTHNVTFSAGSGMTNITNNTAGNIEARTFTAPGTYSFTCSRHAGMGGTVIVQ